MQKLENEFWNHAMVGAGHAAYTDRFHELAKLVLHLVTTEKKRIETYLYGLAPQIRGAVAATEPKTIQKAVQNTEKRGNSGDLGKDRNGRNDNKRGRTGVAFATTVNPEVRGYQGEAPKCARCGRNHMPEKQCTVCFNCDRLGHIAKHCKAPKGVNPVNARNPNAAPRACYECGSTDHLS